MRGRSLSLFSFQFAFKLLIISTFFKFCHYARYTTMKYLLRSYCFRLLDLCRKRNLNNIALTWVTLGENSKFDTLHSFQTHHGKIHILLNVQILLQTYMLLRIVKLQSLQIAPSKSASSLDILFQQQRQQLFFGIDPKCKMRSNFVFLTNEYKISISQLCFVVFISPFFLQSVRYS